MHRAAVSLCLWTARADIGAVRPSSTAVAAGGLVEVFINGRPVQIAAGAAVIQACQAAGIDVPRFCFHERLSVAGNCRMCLVEVERSPKPIASCAMPVSAGMRVWTDTESVKRAREGVMEFLLANHPLDCVVCDQGGECDLQDQSMAYGSDRGRFREGTEAARSHLGGKRAVQDKDFGPLVKTVMTRCIHCTRCVRFAHEVAGMNELGSLGRGAALEIGTYVAGDEMDPATRGASYLRSELSGNVIDLCPVGALTSKPGAFATRPWELRATESIDVHDALGTRISLHARGAKVLRVVPRLHEGVNEEWCSDKARFSYDALATQRLAHPMLRGPRGVFEPVSWEVALSLAAQHLSRAAAAAGRVWAFTGALADVESVLALRDLLAALGSPHVYTDTAPVVHGPSPPAWAASRPHYLFNAGLEGVEQADCLLLIGTHPRWEAPVLNLRLRRAYLNTEGVYPVAVISEPFAGASAPPLHPAAAAAIPDLTYPVTHYLGDGPAALLVLLDDLRRLRGEASPPATFAAHLKRAKRPLIILGSAVLERPDVEGVWRLLGALTHEIRDTLWQGGGWNGWNVLHREAGRVGALDVGIRPSIAARDLHALHHDAAATHPFVYLLNADAAEPLSSRIPQNAFVLYQGHHPPSPLSALAQAIDLILPGSAYTEKEATFVNTEGRVGVTKQAVPPPSGAREDWTIPRAISEVLGIPLPYDSAPALRSRLHKLAPHLLLVDHRPDVLQLGGLGGHPEDVQITHGSDLVDWKSPFKLPIRDYYLTDIISQHSATMAKCSMAFLAPKAAQTESHVTDPM